MAKIKDASGEKQTARVTVNLTESVNRQFKALLKVKDTNASDFILRLIQAAIQANLTDVETAMKAEENYNRTMKELRQKNQ